ncbi:MAG TPA: pilus assembly protein TadG-related protein [Propionibacteriaceae bacterium]
MTDERGTVAVVVALLMVPLLAFGAISLDVAAMYSDKQKLQIGADAGALAIAQVCAKTTCTPAGATAVAQPLAEGNLPGGAPTAAVTSLTSSKVTVATSVVRQHVFARVLGENSKTLSARSTVMWGAPISGTAVLPLAFSWCEWYQQTGGAMPSGTTARTVYFSKTSGTTDCTGPSGNVVPGGFGWITTNASSCQASTAIDAVLHSDPGSSMPNSCSASDLSAVHNKTVLLPIYDESYGSGSGATYVMYGYAAFTVTGYDFGGQNRWNSPCNGNDRCIRGYFSRMVDLSESFTLGPNAPSLGADLIRMTT